MRKQTLGSVLDELYMRDWNVKLRIEAIGDTDEDDPAWATVGRNFEALIIPAGIRDRQASMSLDYSFPLTHNCFCSSDDDIAIGRRLIETHRKDEFGNWHAIPAANVQVFQVLGIERIPGMPEPYTQLRLDLWQMNETRLPADD